MSAGNIYCGNCEKNYRAGYMAALEKTQEVLANIHKPVQFVLPEGTVLIPVQKSPWIPVSERLPEKYGEYIACLKNKKVTELTFSNVNEPHWFKIGVGYEAQENPVTHWQPLPSPPQ